VIAQIRGRLLRKDTQQAVVDVAGVGYGLTIPVSTFYRLGEPGMEVTLLTHTHVREDALKVLGLDPASDLDPRRPLQELGLDSLMAVELRNVLVRAVGEALPATLLFDHPTVDALVSFLATEVLGLTERTDEDESEAEPGPGVVDAIEDLSDEEVERLLAEKMGRSST